MVLNFWSRKLVFRRGFFWSEAKQVIFDFFFFLLHFCKLMVSPAEATGCEANQSGFAVFLDIRAEDSVTVEMYSYFAFLVKKKSDLT